MMRFEIYRQADAAGALATWTWRLQASNGEVIASGEPYPFHQECLDAIALVRAANIMTPVVDLSTGQVRGL
jgi:uncharacterized protein YegP (UPF0339 family)